MEFINLDAVWYAKCEHVDVEAGDKTYNTLELMEEMNDFFVNPNPYGEDVNPFDGQLFYDGFDGSFNDWLKKEHLEVKSIVENLFFHNWFGDAPSYSDHDAVEVISRCKYLVCVGEGGFMGLEVQRSEGGKFIGLKMHNIGGMLNNIDQDDSVDYQICGFHVVDDLITLLLVLKHDGRQRYLYLNDNSCDKVYGFHEIENIVVD